MAYADELKRSALIKILRNPHMSLHAIGSEFGIPSATLHRWYTEARKAKASLNPDDAVADEEPDDEPGWAPSDAHA